MSVVTHYLEKHADESAPLIVMINGILADYQSFDGAVFYARDYAHVLRYNCRGQDQADYTQCKGNDVNTISLKDHVSDLKTLLGVILPTLKGVETVFLVGLSNGGRIALKACEDEDFVSFSKIKAVVALDTYDELSPLLYLKLNSWYEATLIGGALHRFDVASPWIWGESFYNDKSEIILSFRQKIFDGLNAQKSMDVLGLLKGALKNQSDDDRVKLRKINLPVYLIVGTEDLLTTPSLHREMFAKLGNGKLTEVEAMGHAGLIENPMVMKNYIVPFLQTILEKIKARHCS